MAKYKQHYDDDGWFSPNCKSFRQMCCDCSLVHVWSFRIKDGEVQVKIVRNERATAAARRSKRRVMVVE